MLATFPILQYVLLWHGGKLLRVDARIHDTTLALLLLTNVYVVVAAGGGVIAIHVVYLFPRLPYRCPFS